MNQQEKEYHDFYVRFAKLTKEFFDEFNELSSENKQRFQSEVAIRIPFDMAKLQNFLNTKF